LEALLHLENLIEKRQKTIVPKAKPTMPASIITMPFIPLKGIVKSEAMYIATKAEATISRVNTIKSKTLLHCACFRKTILSD